MDSASLHGELVVHANALRRLARDLLRDPHAADDVVQDAMCTAIAKPPRNVAAIAAWLRQVVTRAASDRRRGERRRKSREEHAAAAVDRGATPTDDQVELQQRVLAAVQMLAEPYRTVIWQRYYEDRSPRDIAASSREPVKTVKTRLARGLQKLRERLDASHGSRRAWATLAAPLVAPASPAGLLFMSTVAKFGVAAAIVSVLSVSWWLVAGDTAPASSAVTGITAATPAAIVTTARTDAPVREVAADGGGAARVGATQWAFDVVGGGQESAPLAGIVIDLDGRPMAGIELTWNDSTFDPPVRTAADGTFQCAAGATGRLGVAAKDAVAVLVPTLFGDVFGPGMREDRMRLDLTIVVAPFVRLAGVVVDTNGAPVRGAHLAVQHGVPLRTRIGRVLDRCVDAKFETMTPDDGAFLLAAVPCASTARLTITARGHRPLSVSVEEARHREQFVLERTVKGDVLEGVVVDADDASVGQAVIVLHDHSVVAEPDGTFRFELWRVSDLPAGTEPVLEVASPARLPARVATLGGDWRTRGAWPVPLRIRVGGPAESIRGRVVRADGTPLANPWVTFLPPEPEQIRPTMFDSFADLVFAPPAVGAPDAQNGEFETARVAPGRYRLRVFEPTTLELHLTGEVATGPAAIEIRMPDRGTWPALRGLVVDRRGEPVPGADWVFQRADPTPGAKEPLCSAWNHAGRDGVIEHAPVSRDVEILCVKAAGMAEWVQLRLADLSSGEFRVVVPVGCQTRVELGSQWADVDCAYLLDAGGARSPVVFTNGDTAIGTRRIPISEGCSQTFQALDDCTALVLCRGDREVARFPITLRPGETNVQRW